MPTYDVEMLWECAACGQRGNRGLEPRCSGCGKPKDDRDAEYFPDDVSEGAALSGRKLERAEAGPDWLCKYCGTRQSRADRVCYNCGVDQGTGLTAWRAKGQVLTVDGNGARRLAEGEGGGRDEQWARSCLGDESSSVSASASDARTELMALPRASRRRAVIAAGSAAAACVACLLWWLLTPRYVPASVTAVSWRHSVTVDRYQAELHEGWDAPSDAFDVRDVGKRVRSHEDCDCTTTPRVCTPVLRSCSTTPRTCTSNHNGSATCTGGDQVCTGGGETCTGGDRTCRRCPVYGMWRSWKAWEWVPNRTLARSGASFATSWPTAQELAVSAGAPKERERREADYRTVFTDDKGESFTYRTRTLDEFQSYPVGLHRTLRVTRLGFSLVPPEG